MRGIDFDDMKIVENMDVLPRVFIIGKTRIIKNEQKLIKHLQSDNFDPLAALLVEEDVGYADPYVEGIANIVEYTPNRVRIKAVLDKPGFLVLSDQYYPGWKAIVDGKEVSIHRAYYILRAVRLDSGEHEVVFVFDPLLFKIGCLISVITIVSMLVFLVLRKHRD